MTNLICFHTPETRKELIDNILKYKQMITDFYPAVAKQIEANNLMLPSPFPTSLKLINEYFQIHSLINQTLLQVENYITTIKINNLSSILKTSDIDKLMQLVKIVNDHLNHLNINFLMTKYLDDFFIKMSERKDKDMEFYLPYLSFCEKNLFNLIINNLACANNSGYIIIKHLEDDDIFLNLKNKLTSIDVYN